MIILYNLTSHFALLPSRSSVEASIEIIIGYTIDRNSFREEKWAKDMETADWTDQLTLAPGQWRQFVLRDLGGQPDQTQRLRVSS